MEIETINMPLFISDKITSKNPPLSGESLKHFLSYCKRRKFPKKGIIFREGDPAENLYYSHQN